MKVENLEKIRQRIERLDEELRALRSKAAEIEDQLERQRVIDSILLWSEGDLQKIEKALQDDVAVCLECGVVPVRHEFYGAMVVEVNGKLELQDWESEDYVCLNDPSHEVVLPSWYEIRIEDFQDAEDEEESCEE